MRRHAYSIFTHSVGASVAGHSLLTKIDAVAHAGFNGIELFQDDLDAFAQSVEFRKIQETSTREALREQLAFSHTPPDSPYQLDRRMSGSSTSSHAAHNEPKQPFVDNDDLLVRDNTGELKIGDDGYPMTYNAWGPCTATTYRQELAAALYIASYCEDRQLQIYSLQPLRDYEGWAKEEDQKLALCRARSRFEIMRALGADLLLICSNNQPAPLTTGDLAKIGNDLAMLAYHAQDFGPVMTYCGGGSSAGPVRTAAPIRIGYEALSWGAHVDVWARAWQAVQHADHPNVGLILDSFNTIGREYADPCSPTGVNPDPDAYAKLMSSIDHLRTVPADKIFFLQIGDARRCEFPLDPSPNQHEPRPARMIWSRGNRLFPCEYHLGAFLPVCEFVHAAVVNAGYAGPWSIEVFNSSLNETDPSVPADHAQRARIGLDRLIHQVHA